MNKLKEFYLLNKDSIIKPAATLLVICIVVTLALSLTNKLTSSKIEAIIKKQQDTAIKAILPGDEYKESEGEFEKEKFKYHSVIKDNAVIGYIFTVNEKGYGGDISVMIAVDLEGKVAGVDILDVSNETPGLGQNVKNEKFYKQLIGKGENISVVKSGANAQNSEIDAVTGATISSKAVANAVNTAVMYANTLINAEVEKVEE